MVNLVKLTIGNISDRPLNPSLIFEGFWAQDEKILYVSNTQLKWVPYATANNTDLTISTTLVIEPPLNQVLTIGLNNNGDATLEVLPQMQNQVFAAPVNNTGSPSFRLLVADDIPSLDASKIVSGTFSITQIPNLDANIITTGTLDVNRIPNLNADKITSGVLSVSRIPDLDADKITSGVLSVDRIPDLDANKIASGRLSYARMPNSLSENDIPNLFGIIAWYNNEVSNMNTDQWTDLINGRHMVQATAGFRPTIGRSINDKRSYEFDGVDDRLVWIGDSSTQVIMRNETVIIVANAYQYTLGHMRIFSQTTGTSADGSSGQFLIPLYRVSTTNTIGSYFSAGVRVSTPNIPVDSNVIYAMRYAHQRFEIFYTFLNNPFKINIVRSPEAFTLNQTVNRWAIAHALNSSPASSHIRVGELLIFDSYVENNIMEAIFRYLYNKFQP